MTSQVQALPTYNEPLPADSPAERLARGGGWWTFILALTMLIAMTEALNAAAWSEGLAVVRLATLGGALLAFVLALTRWEGSFPVFYSVVSSVAWLALLFDRFIFVELTAQESFAELVQRNVNWISALLEGSASADNLIFVTQLSLLGWWIGYLALWSLMRHQRVLLAVLPAGVALLVNAYYAAEGMTGFLIIYLAAALLLAIRIELARNEARWQVTRVRYAPDIVFDFLKAGIIFTAIIIFAAWTLPDVANRATMERLLRPFEEPWQRIEDTWQRMYQSINARNAPVVTTAFGKSLNLGGPVSLTDRPIFEAAGPESTYWRAAIFDRYTGAGWLNSDSDIVVLERDEPLGEPLVSDTRTVTYTVQLLEPNQTTIFAPPQPLRVNVPTNADVTETGERPVVRTVSVLRSRVNLSREEPYRVVSAFSTAPIEKLRRDIVDYPPWVEERYLQLPDSVPFRVRDLARRITEAYDNPYDKAEAIEAVLRTYTYNQQVAAPPAGADGVDYFLFESREGYCDYYASAMVVLLRSVGVPARLVVGYTGGQPIAERAEALGRADFYGILERNAHAWPEVYFPSYGWIQFEPTASEPLLARPVVIEPAPVEPGLPQNNAPMSGRDMPQPDDFSLDDEWTTEGMQNRTAAWLEKNWGWLAALAIALVAGATGQQWYRRRQQALFRDGAVLVRLFGLLGAWAGRLGVPWLASATPLERAAEFEYKMPEAAETVNALASLFVAQQYGRQEPAPERLSTLAEGWRSLQPRLWRQWLVGEVARFDPRRRRAEGDKQPAPTVRPSAR